MRRNILSRIVTRLGGLARDARMYIDDFVRSIKWRMPWINKHYINDYNSIAGNYKWVFIVGCNNSGTSIVQRIMNKTGSVSTMRLEGQRYTRVFPRAMRRGKERVWMEYEDDLKVSMDDCENLAPRLIYDWLSHIDKPVREYVLEKTPANLLRMEWLDKAIPECYFIGLVRNGYAVAEGIRRKSHKSIERAAIQWNDANRALSQNKSKVKNYLELRYEDVVSDPATAFGTISRFLGMDKLEIDDAMNIDYGLKTVSDKKIKGLVNLDQASIDRLSNEDMEIINKLAGDMLKYHGYYRPVA